MPFDHWNENVVILGIPYGSENFVKGFWDKKLNDLKDEVAYFKSFHYLTLQAKAIISKSKLLPKMSYVGSTLIMPGEIMAKVDDSMLKFVGPHGKTFLTIENFAGSKDVGGINYAHIVLHCAIMFIRNALCYVKHRKENAEINNDRDYFIEYNIGHQLSNMFNYVCDNRTPHAFQPNFIYQYVLEYLKLFKQIGISDEDLLSCKVRVIYHTIVERLNYQNFNPKNRILHLSVLPNYLTSFNFKVHYNLLPVKSKFMHYALDNESRCKFCKIGFETNVHIFAKCLKLKIVWDFFDEVMALLNINFNFAIQRNVLHHFGVMTIDFPKGRDFKLLVYLNTIINHQLWKYRNQCVHENAIFDYLVLISRIIKSVGSRKNFQQRMLTDTKKIFRLDELFNVMITLRNITFSIDNG